MADRDALERLEKKLDDRTATPDIRRSRLFSRNAGAPAGWQSPGAQPPRRRRFRLIEVALLASFVFFVIALGVAALLFFSGTNTVSTRNVTLAIDGPTSIRAGDVVPLQIAITNRNSVPMELTDMVVEFPPGTRSEADVSVDLPRIRDSLGTINPGESVAKTVRAVVFGQAGTNASVAVTVEYRVPASNAIFHTEGSYTVPISESPASITVDSLKEVVSGQETALTVTVTSNVTSVLTGMVLVATYPPGFAFSSSSPAPLSGKAAWNLGDIEPSGKRTIVIHGTFTGDDTDQKVVHFTAGTAKAGNEAAVAAPLATQDVTLAVAKPFISALLALDGDVATEHVAARGKPIRGDIRWTNNLPNDVKDVEIDVALSGAILDRNSVTTDRGFYRSQDTTVVFSKETIANFADIAPGATGVVSFSFASLPASKGTFRNPDMALTVTVHGRRISEANVPEDITSSASARVVIASDLALQSSMTRTSGPTPPKADHESVYTVTWIVTNSVNAVGNSTVTASLPSYVRWIGSPSPASENVSYNPVGGTVTWAMGDLAEGAAKSVSFQVGITPSLSQVGQSPAVVGDQKVMGLDRFTRTTVEGTAPTLTTQSGTTLQMGAVVP